MPVPDHSGFPLVGDADGGNVGGLGADAPHGLPGHLQLGGENFLRVMLHPARMGENLGEFLLGGAADAAAAVKENTSVGCGSGVQRHQIGRFHGGSSFDRIVSS